MDVVNYDQYVRKFQTRLEAQAYAEELSKRYKGVFRVLPEGDVFIVEQDVAQATL